MASQRLGSDSEVLTNGEIGGDAPRLRHATGSLGVRWAKVAWHRKIWYSIAAGAYGGKDLVRTPPQAPEGSPIGFTAGVYSSNEYSG
ncbi:MAG: hypothetical protein U9N48_01530 [Euryarchaeota archaeon]|nr:hypothetical protein [Euryarchaeota archaeon]